MSYTSTIKVDNLERTVADGVVFKVFFTLKVFGENNEEARYTGDMLLPAPPEEGYDLIPYEDLTNDIVVGWLEAAYPEKLARIKKVTAKECNIDVGEEIAKPW